MFRTRDFLLLFTVIVFLVAAIGVTLFDQWIGASSRSSTTISSTPFERMASTSDLVLTGSLLGDEEGERMQRLNHLREKIAQAPVFQVETAITPDPNPEVAVASSTIVQAASVSDEVIRCTSARAYNNFWDSRGMLVAEREGAIVVERNLETGPEVVLQLPAQTLPAATPNCLNSDVVGIANDGSLIRNDEIALYGIFSSETRVGYALDGFPIYGVSAVGGDVCGGRIVGGQYRYEFSADRDALINCFAAAPVQLP